MFIFAVNALSGVRQYDDTGKNALLLIAVLAFKAGVAQ